MTIKDLIKFLEESAKNCKAGVDTPVRHVRLSDGWHDNYANCRRSSFSLEKKTNAMNDNLEYVNLVIEEEP